MRNPFPRLRFHGSDAVAPLKPVVQCYNAAENQWGFHGSDAVAPLKRRCLPLSLFGDLLIPRLRCRGPIEARSHSAPRSPF